MKITKKVDGDIIFISLKGKMVLNDLADLKDKLLSTIKNSGSNNLKAFVLNLSEIDLLNSNGLGIIASFYTHLKKLNIDFAVCSLDSNFAETFRFMNLHTMFNFYASEQQAKQVLNNEFDNLI